ncbi:hypothetical protein CTI12_AA181320 [Artemisia annua]|uniref:Zinc finger BED domain-containing protein RICESLEEPER 2 n=1 Tax=Artemisia annua TaxID=35608 RepID=A0A2U1P8M8_ARTAN|nr:hypothetical protein CTI12_AA181320 [Artemisia annua]
MDKKLQLSYQKKGLKVFLCVDSVRRIAMCGFFDILREIKELRVLCGELSKQLLVSNKHLILDVSTRWNATYAVFSTALEFKEVFANYTDREPTYTTLPSEEDWEQVEKAHKAGNVVSNVNLGSQSGVAKSSLSSTSKSGKRIKSGTAKYDQHIRSEGTTISKKSEIDTYLEEEVYIGEPGTKIVDMLICGADWYSHYYGLQKKKAKEQVDFVNIELP